MTPGCSERTIAVMVIALALFVLAAVLSAVALAGTAHTRTGAAATVTDAAGATPPSPAPDAAPGAAQVAVDHVTLQLRAFEAVRATRPARRRDATPHHHPFTAG